MQFYKIFVIIYIEKKWKNPSYYKSRKEWKKIVQDPYESEKVESNLILKEGDTLVATFDIEKEPTTDIEVCNQVVKYLSEVFPHNKVMGMFNGVELSVIREE